MGKGSLATRGRGASLRRAVALVVTSIACALGTSHARADVGSVEAPVVYGTDDRIDVYAETDVALHDLAVSSSVVLVPSGYVHADGAAYSLTEKSLGTQFRLCPDQLFFDQPTAAYCSGTLIDDEILGTFAVVAEPDHVGDELLARFGDLVDRISFYAPYQAQADTFAATIERLRAEPPVVRG